MTKITQIASAAVLAAFAGLSIVSTAQAAQGGKTVCTKPHKKFLKTQCGNNVRQLKAQKTRIGHEQRQEVNFKVGPIQEGPASDSLNGGGGGRN